MQPRRAKVVAFTAEVGSSARPLTLVYKQTARDCRVRGWYVPAGNAKQATELAPVAYADLPGFAEVKANAGDQLVAIVTTPATCSVELTARVDAFCELGPYMHSDMAVTCTDADGSIQAPPSVCQRTVAVYNYVKCNKVNGLPKCTQESFSGECLGRYGSLYCKMYPDQTTGYPMPACTVVPP